MRSPDKIGGEIDFSEFLNLMDRLGLVPVIGEQEGPKYLLECVLLWLTAMQGTTAVLYP